LIAVGDRIPPGPVGAYNTQAELLGWLREQFERFGDIYRASIYGAPVYVVSAPEYAEHVLLKNWQNYAKGQAIKRIALLLGKGLMVSEGEFWINQRRMIQPAFHRKAIGALSGLIAAVNRDLLAEWERASILSSPVNVTRDLSRTVLQVVLRSIFGEDYAEVAPRFQILTDQPERNLQFAESFKPLSEIVIQLAVKRRAHELLGNDILGMLMQAKDRDGGQAMPDRQLAKEILTLVVAGHETTASVLNWTWYLLSQHPAVEEKLGQELAGLARSGFPSLDELPKYAYTQQVIEEAMRLYPPGWLMTRKALKDDRLGEYFVPAGTEIYISPYLIQRHPKLWEAPDTFNPDRFGAGEQPPRHPLAMLPFSAGPRNCIGEFLARIEMQIHLMTVAARLRLRLAPGDPPQWVAGVNLLSRHDFIMVPEVY
jgi:cytochrome P450